jgi:TnpA family transposase
MADPNSSLLAYPEFPERITDAVLNQLFTPRPEEIRWVWRISSSAEARLGLLCLLKSFPILGRFPTPEDIPEPIVEYIAKRAGLTGVTLATYPKRTRARHRSEIRCHLGIHRWGGAAETLAIQTIERIVAGRAHLSDLVNGAIEALIAAHYELPALSTLRRLAGGVHARATLDCFAAVDSRLDADIQQRLDGLLIVSKHAQASEFAALCKPTKRLSRSHLDELLKQLQSLGQLSLPPDLLDDVPPARIDAWAEEARRLTATELREYTPARRRTMLVCLIHRTRATRLDDLVTMLVRFVGRIEAKARAELESWHLERRINVAEMVGVLHDIARLRRDQPAAPDLAVKIDAIFQQAGGLERIISACEQHLGKGAKDWRRFIEPQLRPHRRWLYDLIDALPLAASPRAAGVLEALSDLQGEYFPGERADEILESAFDGGFLDPKWRDLVAVPNESGVYRLRALEAATFFELADALKAGDIHVRGAVNYGALTDDIFPIDSEPQAVAQFLRDRGFAANPKNFIQELKRDLERHIIGLERAVADDQTILFGPDRQPVVSRPAGITPPPSARDLADTIQDRMPNRTVLEALSNVERWSGFARHFGPPGRLSAQIEDQSRRCVLTAFAIGSGLGAAQAARHFDEPISAHLLSFVHRRHMGSDSLRAACADVLNIYSKCELPTIWGPSDKVAADGCLIPTWDDNIQTSYHIRYGKTGGVAYRHVGTNYIAYFTHFILAGAYEGTYLFDALFSNPSTVKATGVYSDTHGQSAALFGLAHLLGVELMPRIRRWRSLKLYRSDMTLRLERTGHLYGGVIDWALIESHWKEFLRVALAIQSGRVEASWILTRLNSYSRRNKIYRAFRELGCVLRTIYLLRWIDSEELRRRVTHEANKTEHFHDFAAHLNIGSRGVLRTNSPVDQEKAVIANQLLANSVIAQTVVDQTRIIQQLKREGYPFALSDAKHLSPYLTRHLLRFGKFTTRCETEPLPENLGLDP